MLCNAAKWVPVNEGRLGDRCSPAKDCAAIAAANMMSGIYQFSATTANGLVTSAKEGFCDVATKKIFYDGSTQANFAVSCGMLFKAYPHAADGEKWIGADAKAAKKTECKQVIPVGKPDSRDSVPTNNMIIWWDAQEYQGGSSWPKRGGSLNNPTFYGSKPSRVTGGAGAHAGYHGIKGHTSQHRIRWGNLVRGSWTLCTTSKYDGGSKGRIFTGSGNNWLHGHWGSNAGSSYYQGWIVNGKRNAKKDDWLVWCATNGQSRDIWMNDMANKSPLKAGSGVSTRTNEVGTGWGTHSGEHSHYRIGSVMSWSRSFSTAEMKLVTQYLIDRLNGEAT